MTDGPEDPPPEEAPEETPDEAPEEPPEGSPCLGIILAIIGVLIFPIAAVTWVTWPRVPIILGLQPNPHDDGTIDPAKRVPEGYLEDGIGFAEYQSKVIYGRSIPTTTREVIPSVPTVSTFTNDAPCNRGAVADGETQKFLPLCTFSCAHGYCPSPCICTGYGKESPLPPETGVQACRIQGTEKENDMLCAFACAHGYCPSESCTTGCEETNGKMNKLE
ncbi:hypothetical protein FVEN_g11562 [Fusarium venenatum]|uniref:Uncharacterized protein n=1 Tax=Fusarium venenatum TaxID=56646 RepID=A0A2L2TTT5_9HYPO|nr:uncharacterized protein FVRRES_03978 [Fusarium venenatum]KAG8350218.1 hypothetical protein FVEN_g11562 [Fusarium venenatum]KAH7003054.1 hypothetical protein EDB82DRAFT_570235 [Fusarium venenatum]CEI67466.1 unnamed protein product [Fusarium venenatum]